MTSPDVSAAMVLAAGRGERMRPLSLVVPKPALPLPSGPVVASALRLAAKAGIARVVVNAWHLSHRMTAAVAETPFCGLNVALSVENELMGTAGGVALARNRGMLGDSGSLLVVNGDGYLDLAVDALIEHHARTEDLVTLALVPNRDPGRWSQVVLDPSGHVTEIVAPGSIPKTRDPYLYPGAMVISRPSIDDLPSEPGDIPDRLWWPAMKAGRLGGVVVPGHWQEVGTPADYLEVVIQQLAGTSSVHQSAAVEPTASITNSMIGRVTTIEGGAEIKSSVVGEGAVVRRGARVERSVVMGAVDVMPGKTVIDEVLAEP